MLKMLSGRVALVTGAAQGIGLATAHLLLKSGAKVAAVDISNDVLTKSCDELSKEFGGDNILPLHCDITDKEAFVKTFEKTKEHFGSLDILVNNAGIADENNWEKTLFVNLHAPVMGTYTAMKYMSTQSGGKGGVVVNVSSMAGLIGAPHQPIYVASKHGMVGFTHSIAHMQVETGVRFNCICPVVVDSPGFQRELENTPKELKAIYMKLIEQQGGFLSPEFIAEGIVKLITDTSLNGKVMRVTPRKGHHFQEYPEEANGLEHYIENC